MDSAVGLYVFQVMHHAALTPARVHAGLRLNGQEMRETAQSGLSEDRWQGSQEGRNTELCSWGSNKRCEEDTDWKTKRENRKGRDICESCKTRQ